MQQDKLLVGLLPLLTLVLLLPLLRDEDVGLAGARKLELHIERHVPDVVALVEILCASALRAALLCRAEGPFDIGLHEGAVLALKLGLRGRL